MRLREYPVKGFVLDDARLKQPAGWDYWRTRSPAIASWRGAL
jgi:hypothetical protein